MYLRQCHLHFGMLSRLLLSVLPAELLPPSLLSPKALRLWIRIEAWRQPYPKLLLRQSSPSPWTDCYRPEGKKGCSRGLPLSVPSVPLKKLLSFDFFRAAPSVRSYLSFHSPELCLPKGSLSEVSRQISRSPAPSRIPLYMALHRYLTRTLSFLFLMCFSQSLLLLGPAHRKSRKSRYSWQLEYPFLSYLLSALFL